MVFGDDNSAGARGGCGGKCSSVDWLDGIAVNNTRVDVFFRQDIGCMATGMQRYTSADQSDIVVFAGAERL